MLYPNIRYTDSISRLVCTVTTRVLVTHRSVLSVIGQLYFTHQEMYSREGFWLAPGGGLMAPNYCIPFFSGDAGFALTWQRWIRSAFQKLSFTVHLSASLHKFPDLSENRSATRLPISKEQLMAQYKTELIVRRLGQIRVLIFNVVCP